MNHYAGLDVSLEATSICLVDDRIRKARKQPIEPNEDRPIAARNPWALWSVPSQDVQLMAQNDDFCLQPLTRLKAAPNVRRKKFDEVRHPS